MAAKKLYFNHYTNLLLTSSIWKKKKILLKTEASGDD